jgi:hypothetical protein
MIVLTITTIVFASAFLTRTFPESPRNYDEIVDFDFDVRADPGEAAC